MTRTVLESKTKTVIIGFDEPFCVIGERINPTGRKKLAAELETIQSIELDLPILKISKSDLNLDANKSLNPVILEGLMHIVDE